MPLPEAYRWLEEVSELPRIIVEGLQLLGVVEKVGNDNNPLILSWARELGLEAVYKADEIPWCGLFAGVVVKRAGFPVVKDPLWARNWQHFGLPVKRPGLGDVLAFKRGTGGHVGFMIGIDKDRSHYHVLGGNQGDAVSIVRIAANRLLAARRPDWRVRQPDSVKEYLLDPIGSVSTDEA